MEKLIVLGTGSGLTINCYSLSALLENTNGNYLLIDTGSGNQILNHLKAKNININKIHDIFISHKHIDHLWGIIPLLRYIMQQHRKSNRNTWNSQKLGGACSYSCHYQKRQGVQTGRGNAQ